MKFDMCRAKLKGKRGGYYQSDVRKLLCCTHSRILQTTNAVHLTMVLCVRKSLCCTHSRILQTTNAVHLTMVLCDLH